MRFERTTAHCGHSEEWLIGYALFLTAYMCEKYWIYSHPFPPAGIAQSIERQDTGWTARFQFTPGARIFSFP
jgi:hypothetical protein